MLKAIALAGVFLFSSAFSMAATQSPPKKQTPAKSATDSSPTSPQPKGFCWPPGRPYC
jgi:hypothetical protein